MSQPIRGSAFAALLLVLAVVPAGLAALATPPSLALEREFDVNRHDVWRGIAYRRGMVVNPSLTATCGDGSSGAWGNLDRDPRASRASNERELALGWSTEVLGVGVARSGPVAGRP